MIWGRHSGEHGTSKDVVNHLIGRKDMIQQMAEYIQSHTVGILIQVRDHLLISFYALLIAAVIGVIFGYFASRSGKSERWISFPFSVLRVIPSLAVLVLLIPIMGISGAAIASIITQFFTNVFVGYLIPAFRPNNKLLVRRLNPRLLKDMVRKIL